MFRVTNIQESVCVCMCRMVLGSCDCGSGSRCASRGVWRSFFGTGQQPPSVHVDPLGQDCTRTHQYTDPVQRRPVSARLQLPGPAQPVVVPQRAQPGAALHGTREESGGREGGAGDGSFETLSADNSGNICGIKAEAGRVQAPRPPLVTAPHTPRHQQTLWLPRPATTPEASNALHKGLSLQGMMGVPQVQYYGWISADWRQVVCACKWQCCSSSWRPVTKILDTRSWFCWWIMYKWNGDVPG